MNDINYRAGGEAVRRAWFAYRATNPYPPLSLVSFVAGYNAALADKALQEDMEAFAKLWEKATDEEKVALRKLIKECKPHAIK